MVMGRRAAPLIIDMGEDDKFKILVLIKGMYAQRGIRSEVLADEIWVREQLLDLTSDRLAAAGSIVGGQCDAAILTEFLKRIGHDLTSQFDASAI